MRWHVDGDGLGQLHSGTHMEDRRDRVTESMAWEEHRHRQEDAQFYAELVVQRNKVSACVLKADASSSPPTHRTSTGGPGICLPFGSAPTCPTK